MSSPHHHTQSGQLSFWSESTATAGTQFGGGPLGSVKEAEWTTVIPPELIAASGEEENYLTTADSSASSTSIPAPNIPPAPLLPRHLDKLILNVRPATVTGAVPSSGSSSGDKERSSRKGGSRSHRNRERDRDRDRDRTEREARPRPTSNLGMTSTSSNTNATLVSSIPEGTLPIVTASGTDVTALASGPPTPNPGESASEQTSGATTPSIAGGARKVTVASLGGPGLADDASVLPVPSHVVLHHLSTSAIRNGVLAVANTTRYKKKVGLFRVCLTSVSVLTLEFVCSISQRSITSQPNNHKLSVEGDPIQAFLFLYPFCLSPFPCIRLCCLHLQISVSWFHSLSLLEHTSSLGACIDIDVPISSSFVSCLLSSTSLTDRNLHVLH